MDFEAGGHVDFHLLFRFVARCTVNSSDRDYSLILLSFRTMFPRRLLRSIRYECDKITRRIFMPIFGREFKYQSTELSDDTTVGARNCSKSCTIERRQCISYTVHCTITHPLAGSGASRTLFCCLNNWIAAFIPSYSHRWGRLQSQSQYAISCNLINYYSDKSRSPSSNNQDCVLSLLFGIQV